MTDENVRRLELAYPILAARRVAYDQMMWQTPTLAFTAQAFLFTIALETGASRLERLLPAALALTVALLSIQLLRKHEHMELVDSVALEQMERDLGLPTALGTGRNPLHTPAPRRREELRLIDGRALRGGRFIDLNSPTLWVAGQAAFALASLVIIAITVAAPEVLS